MAEMVGYQLEPKVSSLPSFKGRVANDRDSPYFTLVMIPYYCHNNSEEFYLICTIFLVTFCGGKGKSAETSLELLLWQE